MIEGRRVYIIGFMGSGKTTVGKKLAAELGWHFLDLDKQIELQTGRLIKDIFHFSGEDNFRKLEAETLFNLKTAGDIVISTGGGTPCYGTNLEYMKSTGLVIYLKMTPRQLKRRLEGSSGDRPLINHLSKSELLKYISDKLSEREDYYLKASLVVDGINLDIKTVSSIIIAGL